MYSDKILDWLNSNANYTITKIMKQYWKESKYSYSGAPRSNYGLLLVVKGSINFVNNGETLTARAGNLIFLPKGSRYEAVFPDTAEDYLVSFDSDEKDILIPSPVLLLNDAAFACSQRFLDLINEKISPGHSLLQSKGLFYLLLNTVVNEIKKPDDTHSLIVNRACEIIQKNTDASIGEVARLCAVSESSLRQLFKSQMQITPTHYRTQTKIKQAIYLLESTDLSLSEISEKLGFFDAAYFCKIFRQQMGMTPKQYVSLQKI